MREPTPEQFLKDVERHRLTALHDHGLYRHLRFQSPDHSWNMWFDLITWPGNLTIRGDMGTWTFSRVEDMFTFFRGDDLKINPDYWAEKLQHGTHGGRDGALVWDEETWKKHLLDQVGNYFNLEGSDLEEVTAELKEDVLRQDGKYWLMMAAYNFKCEYGDGQKFKFDPCELPTGMVYAYHFIWCCYAIVWGIQQWDAIAKNAAEVAREFGMQPVTIDSKREAVAQETGL